MKRILTAAFLGVAVISGWAQGTIDFRNGGISFPTVADRFVYLGAIGGTKLAGTNYVAGLFYLAGANAAIDSPTAGTQAGELARFRNPTSLSIGLWLNATAIGNTRVLDGVTFNQTATIQIRVWDSSVFNSYAAAFAAGQYGASAPFNYTVPSQDNIDPSKYYMDGLRAFAVVPEPSMIALGALGVASLLFLRRRKVS
jgi:hypothetical protein